MYPYFFHNYILLVVLVVWSLLCKGYALWVAAKHDQKKWFIALLILNTFGILEIVYIFFVLKKKWIDVKKDFTRGMSSITK